MEKAIIDRFFLFRRPMHGKSGYPQRPPTSRHPPSSERRSSRSNWRRSRRSRCPRRRRSRRCRGAPRPGPRSHACSRRLTRTGGAWAIHTISPSHTSQHKSDAEHLPVCEFEPRVGGDRAILVDCDDRQRPSATIGNGHRQRSATAIGNDRQRPSATIGSEDRQRPSATIGNGHRQRSAATIDSDHVIAQATIGCERRAALSLSTLGVDGQCGSGAATRFVQPWPRRMRALNSMPLSEDG